jgi:regulator of replication initiation timing
MADFELVKRLRKQSINKHNDADEALREVHTLSLDIRSMEDQIKDMRFKIESLTHTAHKLRVEGDRLKNQAFTMSLGAFNE